jgi:hypothetical protein
MGTMKGKRSSKGCFLSILCRRISGTDRQIFQDQSHVADWRALLLPLVFSFDASMVTSDISSPASL